MISENQTTPPLKSDQSFWAVMVTQFLGAFNDNVFKMLLMLICADYVLKRGVAKSPYFDPYQTLASLLFALSFILFSGVAGFLADRHSKRSIILNSKIAEMVVMLAGLFVFLLAVPGTNSFLIYLFAVLFLMGLQSAFFGPSKYGIFPELFSAEDLPAANGIAQLTTFVAIIFGAALAGPLKDWLQPDLYLVSIVCVGIAVVGTISASFIRHTPKAQPDLKFSGSSFFLERIVWKKIWTDRSLFHALIVYAVFWFVGGVVFLVVTLVSKVQFGLGDMITSVLNAVMGLGIGTGCVVAAVLSNHKIKLSLVSMGSRFLLASTVFLSLVAVLPLPVGVRVWLFGGGLLVTGFFGGWVAVPLQVFIQVRPSAQYKGRVIAAMNLITWIGILMASVYYYAFLAITGFKVDPSWIMGSLGFIMWLATLLLLPRIVKSEASKDSEAD